MRPGDTKLMWQIMHFLNFINNTSDKIVTSLMHNMNLHTNNNKCYQYKKDKKYYLNGNFCAL